MRYIRRYLAPYLTTFFGRNRFVYLNEIRKVGYFNKNQIQSIQRKKIIKVLGIIKHEIPFYKDYFSKITFNYKENPYQTLETLPILNKIHFINNFKKMKVEKTHNCHIGQTGGSTGIRMKYLFDNYLLEMTYAGMMRSLEWGGWNPGEPIAMLWGGLQEFKNKKFSTENIKGFITGRHWIKTYEINDQKINEWLNHISKYNINYLYGYASVINRIADYIKDKNIKKLKIKAIFTTAETLFQNYRNNIETVFQCKVYNQYGSREITNIASECNCGNLHLLSDMIYAEFQREKFNTQLNRIILTNLNNFKMPFVRYDLEDFVEPIHSNCSCGINFPVIKIQEGRVNDFFKMPSGKLIYPSYFIHLLDNHKDVLSFQFIQKDLNEVTLNYTSKNNTEDTSLCDIEKKVADELQWNLKIKLNLVDEIFIPKSGKHRFVICKIN